MKEYTSIGIPTPLATRIRHIFKLLGYKSISDFLQKAALDKLPREESRFEEIQEAIKSGEYEKWQKE